MVMNGTTVRGSIVGTREDLKEALMFAEEGKVKAEVKTEKLENVNSVLDKMRHGQILGRIALDFRS
jgi:propanol-preferring alcohol dehydrogenase